MNIFELPSWSEEEISKEQKDKYHIMAVGESIHSCRTTFEVQCNTCCKILHTNTNNPSHYIEIHDRICNDNKRN